MKSVLAVLLGLTCVAAVFAMPPREDKDLEALEQDAKHLEKDLEDLMTMVEITKAARDKERSSPQDKEDGPEQQDPDVADAVNIVGKLLRWKAKSQADSGDQQQIPQGDRRGPRPDNADNADDAEVADVTVSKRYLNGGDEMRTAEGLESLRAAQQGDAAENGGDSADQGGDSQLLGQDGAGQQSQPMLDKDGLDELDLDAAEAANIVGKLLRWKAKSQADSGDQQQIPQGDGRGPRPDNADNADDVKIADAANAVAKLVRWKNKSPGDRAKGDVTASKRYLNGGGEMRTAEGLESLRAAQQGDAAENGGDSAGQGGDSQPLGQDGAGQQSQPMLDKDGLDELDLDAAEAANIVGKLLRWKAKSQADSGDQQQIPQGDGRGPRPDNADNADDVEVADAANAVAKLVRWKNKSPGDRAKGDVTASKRYLNGGDEMRTAEGLESLRAAQQGDAAENGRDSADQGGDSQPLGQDGAGQQSQPMLDKDGLDELDLDAAEAANIVGKLLRWKAKSQADSGDQQQIPQGDRRGPRPDNTDNADDVELADAANAVAKLVRWKNKSPGDRSKGDVTASKRYLNGGDEMRTAEGLESLRAAQQGDAAENGGDSADLVGDSQPLGQDGAGQQSEPTLQEAENGLDELGLDAADAANIAAKLLRWKAKSEADGEDQDPQPLLEELEDNGLDELDRDAANAPDTLGKASRDKARNKPTKKIDQVLKERAEMLKEKIALRTGGRRRIEDVAADLAAAEILNEQLDETLRHLEKEI